MSLAYNPFANRVSVFLGNIWRWSKKDSDDHSHATQITESTTVEVLQHELKHVADATNLVLMASSATVRMAIGGVTGSAGMIIINKLSGSDHTKASKARFVLGLASVAGLGILSSSVIYKLDPLEKSANKFSDECRNNNQWADLVKLRPRA